MNVDSLTPEKIQKLAAHKSDVCLTISMPTFLTGKKVEENAIRFKNCLEEAVSKMKKMGFQEDYISEFLKPLYSKLDDKEFWQFQGKGLFVCLSEKRAEFYRLAFEVKTNVIVDKFYFIRPLAPLLEEQRNIALLLLDTKEPKLVFSQLMEDASSTALDIQTPEGELASFDSFLNTHDFEKALSASSGESGGRDMTYHGQGTAGDEAVSKQYFDEYLKKLESWVVDTLSHRQNDAVFVVADATTLGHYKNQMRDTHPLLREVAQKNPASGKTQEWLDLALESFRESREESEAENLKKMLEKYQNQSPDRIDEDIESILLAAHEKRIDSLIIPEDTQDYIWGDYDFEGREIHLQKNKEAWDKPGNELINLALIETLANNGKIFRAPANENRPEITAIYRW